MAGVTPRRIALYSVAALLSAALLVSIDWKVALELVLGWLPSTTLASLHPSLVPWLPHRLHNVSMSVIESGFIVGIALQLYKPERWLAPLLQALAFIVVIVGIEIVTAEFSLGTSLRNNAPFLILVPLMLVLHPRAGGVFRVWRIDRVMAALVLAAALPWIVFAIGQAHLQQLSVAGDEHARLEHWKRMATFASLIVLWGAISVTDYPGWRITAWFVGLGATIYALQSLLFSGLASAAPLGWAIAAGAWGSTSSPRSDEAAPSPRTFRNSVTPSGDEGLPRHRRLLDDDSAPCWCWA